MSDEQAAKVARDDALERVERGASPEWLAEADRVVRFLAGMGRPFTPDDVWKRMRQPPPREPRALGPVMMHLVREKVIEKTGKTINTKRAVRHAAPITEWIGVPMKGVEF